MYKRQKDFMTIAMMKNRERAMKAYDISAEKQKIAQNSALFILRYADAHGVDINDGEQYVPMMKTLGGLTEVVKSQMEDGPQAVNSASFVPTNLEWYRYELLKNSLSDIIARTSIILQNEVSLV